MKLYLHQRIGLINLLPPEGSIEALLQVKEIRAKLADLSDEYKTKIEYKQIDPTSGKFHYESSKDEAEEFEFSESEKHILKLGIDFFDKKGTIPAELLDVCLEIKNF